MKNLSDVAKEFVVFFPELRVVSSNKCLKILGDLAIGFQFERVRGQIRTYFVLYSLWDEIAKGKSGLCLVSAEIHNKSGLQVPFKLDKAEKALDALVSDSRLSALLPLEGDVTFAEFLTSVQKARSNLIIGSTPAFLTRLLWLAMRTSSYCGQHDAALKFFGEIDALSSRYDSVIFESFFWNMPNWRSRLQNESQLGLSGRAQIDANVSVLSSSGLVISRIS